MRREQTSIFSDPSPLQGYIPPEVFEKVFFTKKISPSHAAEQLSLEILMLSDDPLAKDLFAQNLGLALLDLMLLMSTLSLFFEAHQLLGERS